MDRRTLRYSLRSWPPIAGGVKFSLRRTICGRPVHPDQLCARVGAALCPQADLLDRRPPLAHKSRARRRHARNPGLVARPAATGPHHGQLTRALSPPLRDAQRKRIPHGVEPHRRHRPRVNHLEIGVDVDVGRVIEVVDVVVLPGRRQASLVSQPDISRRARPSAP